MQILYTIKRPLTGRDFERHGIEAFLAQGHGVTVLDLSDFIHPDLVNDRSENVHADGLDIEIIATREELLRHRGTFENADLVVLLIQSFGLSRHTYLPLKMVAACGTPYLIQTPPSYPGWNPDGTGTSARTRASDLWRRAAGIDPVNSVLSRISPEWLGVPRAAYAVHSSIRNGARNNLLGPSTRNIEAHCHDYDLFLREKAAITGERDQAVFLDQYVPFHADFRVLNAAPIDPETYYGNLRRVFDRIEGELGLQVVIAAHPRADYGDGDTYFGDRLVVKGRTAKLVGESRLVLAHNSVSIAFAVMFRKPILLLVTEAMYRRHVYQKHIFDGFSEELNVPLQFFDDPESVAMPRGLEPDEDCYDRFLATYCRCPNAPEKTYWDIVLDAVSVKDAA